MRPKVNFLLHIFAGLLHLKHLQGELPISIFSNKSQKYQKRCSRCPCHQMSSEFHSGLVKDRISEKENLPVLSMVLRNATTRIWTCTESKLFLLPGKLEPVWYTSTVISYLLFAFFETAMNFNLLAYCRAYSSQELSLVGTFCLDFTAITDSKSTFSCADYSDGEAHREIKK